MTVAFDPQDDSLTPTSELSNGTGEDQTATTHSGDETAGLVKEEPGHRDSFLDCLRKALSVPLI